MTSGHDILFVPSQFATMQEAMDAVVRPTTIMVEPGVYRESLVVAGKQYVVIQSTRLSRRGVTVAGHDGAIAVFQIERSTLHLSGLDVRSNGRLRGMWVSDSIVTLQDCVLAGNRTYTGETLDGYGAGMRCQRSSVRIQKSTVAGNTIYNRCLAEEDARGTQAWAGDKTNRGENIVKAGRADPGTGGSIANAGGIIDALGAGLYFEACTVEIAGSSIQVNAAHSATRACGGGIWFEGGRMRMWRSRVTDNALTAQVCEGGGIYLKDPLRCELGGSVVTGNGWAACKGGGIFIEGDPGGVAIHRNTAVRQNHPDDVYPPSR